MGSLPVPPPQYGPTEFGGYTTVSVFGGVFTVEGCDYVPPSLADGVRFMMENFADPHPAYQVRRRSDMISVWIIYRYLAGATHAAGYSEPAPAPGNFDGLVGLPT